MSNPVQDAYLRAVATETAFENALTLAGYRSRWHWHLGNGPDYVAAAYRAKVAADLDVHSAFVASRSADSVAA